MTLYATEGDLMRDIQVDATGATSRMWRNNNGVLIDRYGNHVTYGLCPGSSDLIGLRTVVVTPDMVGQRLAVFCAVEVKLPANTRRPQEQRAYIDIVRQLGGRAGFATTVEEASGILCGASR